MKSCNTKSIIRLITGVALMPMAMAATSAFAADAEGDQAAASNVADTGDIIVTAQRREQSVNKVPMSLTALDTSALETRQVADMRDLQFAAPGIRAGQQQGVTRIFIRGIGLNSFSAGADPSIAFYADGIYIGRPTAQASSFYDVSRIEVLRGPQGALYGRNATGGAVNVISNAPTREFGGYLNLTAGNYSLFEGEGAINAPLSANGDLRARVSAHVVDRGGYGYDFGANHEINNAKTESVRGQLQYENGTGLNIRLIGEYHHENDYNNYTMSFGAYPGYTLQGVAGTPDPMGEEGDLLQGIYINGLTQDTASALVGKTNVREGAAITLNATFPINDAISLNTITGYRSWDRYNASNSDGTSAGLGSTYYTETSKQFSHEVVFNITSGPLSMVVGGSYYHEKLTNYVLVPFIQFGPVNYIQDGKMKIDAYAAYAQATYAIVPAVRLTVGGRFSSETRATRGTFDFLGVTPTDGTTTWKKFNPKAGIEADIGPNTLVYATATNGFKSGTYNVGQVNPVINPEKIWAYEVGFKTKLFDNTLQLSGAAFHYDYSDLQVNKVIGIATVTTNAASAKIDGFEVAATWRPVPGLTLDGSFNYIHARFSQFFSTNPLYPTGPTDPGFEIWQAANPGASAPLFGGAGGAEQNLEGYMLPGAPKYSATAGIQYDYHTGSGGTFTARADMAWSSRIHYSEFNDIHLSQGPIAKVNAFLKYDSGSFWNVSIWGKNLTDRNVIANNLITIALWGYPRYGAIEPPRTFGGTVGLKF